MDRRVVCAAIRRGHIIIASPRHFDDVCRATLKLTKLNAVDWEQGFLDAQGFFMNRQEAWHIAVAAHQILRLVGGNDTDGGTLYSENLY